MFLTSKQSGVLLLGLGLAFAACAEDKPKQTSKKGAEEGEGEGEGTESGEPAKNLVGEGDFGGWCKAAAKAKQVKNQLKEYHGDFCDGDTPKQLFTATLIGKAYAGTGEPKLHSIQAITSEPKADKTTKYYFAVGIKLPMKIEDHFNKVGPKAGDVESQKKLAEANGAVAEVEVLEEFKDEGDGHVRGWLVHNKATKDLKITKIVTETNSRSDQYEFKKGELYMYTQYADEAIETVKVFDMLTAGIKVKEDSYLLALISIAVGNKGFDGPAEDEIKKTAAATVKLMYKAAAEAK